MVEQRVAIGVATRPHPGEVDNGDYWAVDWYGAQCRVSVIDGLGHGPAAAEAAHAAREKLAAHPGVDPVEALSICHHALGRTRGACMFVASIDTFTSRVICAGVGNVETRLWQRGREQRLTNHRGIIGSRVPELRPIDVKLEAPWILVMHSDGVSTRFAIPQALKDSDGSPQSLADTIMSTCGRDTDDAIVLVVAANNALSSAGNQSMG